MGYAGIFSLAHAAVYGIGAYASALAALQLGLGFWGGLLVAAVVGALAAALVAIPSLRVAGDYYIVASFGLQVVILATGFHRADAIASLVVAALMLRAAKS